MTVQSALKEFYKKDKKKKENYIDKMLFPGSKTAVKPSLHKDRAVKKDSMKQQRPTTATTESGL